MASLGPQIIKDSYANLIQLPSYSNSLTQAQTGAGTSLPFSVSSTVFKFLNTADFTGVTVTGFTGGAITSVNGQTGVVVLTAANVGALATANNLSDLANAGTARTNLGLGSLATQSGTFSGTSSGTNTGNVTLAGETYISIASQVITAAAVNLSGSQATGTLAAARMPALTGDVTTSAGAVATALATVNSNVGSFTHANVTVNAKGLVTAVSSGKSLIPVTFLLAQGVNAATGTSLTSNITIPFAGTITKVYINAKTGPTGADLICDINKNGTSIWATTQANRIKIVAGATTGTQTSFDTTTVADGDVLSIDIDQIGSTITGKDISVIIKIEI